MFIKYSNGKVEDIHTKEEIKKIKESIEEESQHSLFDELIDSDDEEEVDEEE